MTRPTATSQFTAAKDSNELGRLLHEYFVRSLNPGGGPQAWAPVVLQVEARMQPGTLLQLTGNGRARRAGATADRSAQMVLVAMLPDGSAICAAIVQMGIALGSAGFSTTSAELWLGPIGEVTATKPTTGLIQKVGLRIDYDGKTQNHLCLLQPDPGGGTYVYP